MTPHDKRIASAGNDETVQVWGAANGSNVFTYRGHTKLVTVVVWSLDGTRIASASNDKTVQVSSAGCGEGVEGIHFLA